MQFDRLTYIHMHTHTCIHAYTYRRAKAIGKVTGPFGNGPTTSGSVSFSAVCHLHPKCRLPKTGKQLGGHTYIYIHTYPMGCGLETKFATGTHAYMNMILGDYLRLSEWLISGVGLDRTADHKGAWRQQT